MRFVFVWSCVHAGGASDVVSGWNHTPPHARAGVHVLAVAVLERCLYGLCIASP